MNPVPSASIRSILSECKEPDYGRQSRRQLRQIVKDCDPAITAQIMVASKRLLGTVKDVTLN